MPRRDVELCSGNYYHLYNRGVNKQCIFFAPENYAFFLRRLRKYFTPDTVEIIAYCLLPNHYHLLIYLKGDDLADIMQSFSMSYAKAINERYGRTGHLFQGRFKGKLVDRDKYLLHLSRYIHLNPVMAELVQKPETWEYSSYLEYVGLRHGTLPHPEVVFSVLGTQLKTPGDSESAGVFGRAYQEFVESYCEHDLRVIRHLLLED
ncbi:MAG: transposase [Chloroflexi bacterium]|nr:transposase [Chloroflexota bacterium]